MKYNENNTPLVCMQTQSRCYKKTSCMNVKGVLWHSTGANNTTIKRYVQPSDDDPNREELLKVLGVNSMGNDWNHVERNAGLNAFIGKLSNGTIAAVQTMPWDYRPWGCGEHPVTKLSCNSGWIQFEICEDGLSNKDYFEKVYKEACELTAYLCKMYGIDPLGTVKFCGRTIPRITCHNDAYKLEVASAHDDINHWFPKYGKSMETVREDVAALLEEKEVIDEMRYFEKIEEVPEWYRPTIQKLIDQGALKGGDTGLHLSEDFCRMMTVFDRLGKLD